MKKCKYCGTTENLRIDYRKNKGTVDEKIIYRNECISCHNKNTFKGFCKHCGTTENLVVTKIRNKTMEEPIIVTKNICISCREKFSRVANIGKIVSNETRSKHRLNTLKLNKNIEYKEKQSKSQIIRCQRPEEKKRRSTVLLNMWNDKNFRELKSKSSKDQWENSCYKEAQSKRLSKKWEDPKFRELISSNLSKRLFETWKDPNYREKMIHMSKETWSDPIVRKKQSDRCKDRLKNNNPFDNNGLIKISKEEQKLFDLVKIVFPSAEQNKSIKTKESRRFPDILIEDYKLIFEYDGSYWHKSEKDDKRNKELQDVGYKIIHYIDRIPDMKELFNDADKVLNR